MSDSEEDVDLERQVKISLVGEPSTGKSMLCARYLGLQWGGLTQGADVLLGECPPPRPARPPVPLKLCDVAGTGRDSPMLANYIYASHIIILVYDITNLQSFERLGLWLESVSDILAGADPVPVLAVFGNKSDLEHQRAVRLGCVNDFAAEFGCLNFSGSARTGENVNATIISLVSHVLGIPINKSHLVNSSILKAELAPHNRPLRNVPNNTQLITAKIKETDKQSNENNKMVHGKQKSNRIKKDSIKHNKKVMKELKWKATSAVCNLQ